MPSLNRLASCHNMFQGSAKKVLCLCSAGLLRSPTAAVVLQREFGFNTRAAGVQAEYALIPVDDVLLEWADEVVVMEGWMLSEIKKYKGIKINLGIPDSFIYMDEELQRMIKEQYESHLKNDKPEDTES